MWLKMQWWNINVKRLREYKTCKMRIETYVSENGDGKKQKRKETTNCIDNSDKRNPEENELKCERVWRKWKMKKKVWQI